MKKYFFIYILPLILFSCKKKEDVDTSPSGTPIQNITPSDSSHYQALFSCLNVYTKNSGSYTPTGNTASAYYSTQPITNEIYYAQNLENMGTVSLDSIVFKNKSNITSFYYNDTTGTQFTLPHNWIISGNSSINTFSYSNGNTPPLFSASGNIPDSISTSTGFTIAINGTVNCDLIRVFLLGGTGSSAFPNKLFSGTDTLIAFSASDLQGVSTTTAGYISVQLYKDHYRTISGNRVNFRTGLQYNNYHFKIKP